MNPPETIASLASPSANEAEAARVMGICNACRYCEGFCAVFPAMTHRLEFPAADLHYLANLCHNCGACLHACQYAAPHEFDVNVPRSLARLRVDTYADFAWPAAFGGLYRRNGLTLSLALAAGLALFLVLALVMNGTVFGAAPDGNFYRVFPHNLMVWLFGPVFLGSMLALGIGVTRFWRRVSPGERDAADAPAMASAARDALGLHYLDGGHGEGCNEEDDRWTHARRHAHHMTFYGFMLCFAATSVATIYHYVFGWPAPYAYTSLPVVLGTLGGLGLLVGPAALLGLNVRRHPEHGDARQAVMDRGFIALLFFTSLTGLALLALREGVAMPLLLAVHLGFVMAMFLTFPYSKFAHGFYRTAALLKWAVEKRRAG